MDTMMSSSMVHTFRLCPASALPLATRKGYHDGDDANDMHRQKDGDADVELRRYDVALALTILLRDIIARRGRFSWLSLLLRLSRRAEVFPLASFGSLVTVQVAQNQTDNEEQRSQYRGHASHKVTRPG